MLLHTFYLSLYIGAVFLITKFFYLNFWVGFLITTGLSFIVCLYSEYVAKKIEHTEHSKYVSAFRFETALGNAFAASLGAMNTVVHWKGIEFVTSNGFQLGVMAFLITLVSAGSSKIIVR